jgi:cytochrome c5
MERLRQSVWEMSAARKAARDALMDAQAASARQAAALRQQSASLQQALGKTLTERECEPSHAFVTPRMCRCLRLRVPLPLHAGGLPEAG